MSCININAPSQMDLGPQETFHFHATNTFPHQTNLNSNLYACHLMEKAQKSTKIK